MSSKAVFVVFGATGAQGGSVIRAVLGSPELTERFRIRAVCRDTTKPAARLLQEKGIEVVSANLSKKEEVSAVLSDANSVFLVTDYTGNAGDPRVELQQGKNVADAAKEHKLHHVIFSSLSSGKKLSSGTITDAREFDSKAAIEDYMRELQLPATFVYAGFYMNLCAPGNYLQPLAGDDKTKYEFAVPFPVDVPVIAAIDTPTDYGKFVRAALLNRDKYLGERLYAAEAYYSLNQIADIVNSSGQGLHVTTRQLSDEDLLKQKPFTGTPSPDRQIQQLSMFRFVRQYGYYAGASLDSNAEIIGEPLRTYKDFVKNGFK